jgi:hypothetical protein
MPDSALSLLVYLEFLPGSTTPKHTHTHTHTHTHIHTHTHMNDTLHIFFLQTHFAYLIVADIRARLCHVLLYLSSLEVGTPLETFIT